MNDEHGLNRQLASQEEVELDYENFQIDIAHPKIRALYEELRSEAPEDFTWADFIETVGAI